MRCEKCGNRIKELFFKRGKDLVCRNCLVYKTHDEIYRYIKGKGTYYLDYELTSKQKEAANFILNEVKNKRSCILNAVTGAGKTEIIYPLIKYCIDNDLRVGIAIPRKDVVMELFSRIKRDFKDASVASVYGGCNKSLYADIVIATTHQLYRYEKYFDVVIIDEVDAFPFYNNSLLNHFLKRSIKGSIVYMSATISKNLIKTGLNIYYLNRRYHNEKLDVPSVKYYWSNYFVRKKITKYKSGILIVYFPTIKLQLEFAKTLKINHCIINSKTPNRKQLLEELHNKEHAVILSTLVMERGITFKNTNVIVVNADHCLFGWENLVQISGRVGRHSLYAHGDITFFVNWKSKQVKQTINFIKKCNE